MKKTFLVLILSLCALSYQASAQTATENAAKAVTDTTVLKEYAGKYRFTGLPFDFMDFTLKESKLTVQAGDQGGPLVAVKDAVDKFETADSVAKFSFIRDEQKKITKVTVDYHGMTLEGKKE